MRDVLIRRGEDNEKRVAEIGAMHPQAKEPEGLPRGHQKLGERYGMDCFSEPPVGTNLFNTLILDF